MLTNTATYSSLVNLLLYADSQSNMLILSMPGASLVIVGCRSTLGGHPLQLLATAAFG